MTSIQIYGSITEDHKLEIHNRKKLLEELNQCKPCEVIITIKKKGRVTTPQRGFYFGVIVSEIRLRLTELGHRMTNEEVHEFLKLNFNPRHLADEHGEVIATFPGSTTEMNVSEMAEYMNAIIEWAATAIDCHIPPANSSNIINFDL